RGKPAARQAARWDGRVKISVNLSARQFADPELARSLVAACEAVGVPGTTLTLEITETALMQDVDAHVATMMGLRTAGFRFSIDDFGTGYSSLAYLRRFPLDCLKIDRGFTADMMISADARAIVSATIALAHNLRLRVIAEGVETAEQARLLAELGADLQQGYHHGRPTSAEEFARLWGLEKADRAR
ncbi:MAG: EAL domain-containing protein, partial [Guyparkeria sp.]